PCATVLNATIEEPDFGTFLDCGTHVLKTPQFTADVKVVQRKILLEWTASVPGATYVLEETQRGNFAQVREIYRGSDLTHTVYAAREGIFYYRVHAVTGDEHSADSAVVSAVVRDDQWVA